jgi:hypothetical protein
MSEARLHSFRPTNALLAVLVTKIFFTAESAESAEDFFVFF